MPCDATLLGFYVNKRLAAFDKQLCDAANAMC